MAPKSDPFKPAGPATRSRKQETGEEPSAATFSDAPAAPEGGDIGRPPSDPIADGFAQLQRSFEEMAARQARQFDELAADQSRRLEDLSHRLDTVESRSGRVSPRASSSSAPTAPAAPSAASCPSPTTAPKAVSATSAAEITATTQQRADPLTDNSAPPRGAHPWSHWDERIRSDVAERLARFNLSLTKLYNDTAYDAYGRSRGSTRDDTSSSARPVYCKHETLGSFEGDPTKLEAFISRVRDIGRKRIPGWEDAVLAAVPDALSGHAAKWHASLTTAEVERMGTLEDLFAAMRRAFPVNRAQLRTDARMRKWEPRAESAMNYFYDKVLLMRQAFGETYAEQALAQDVADGLEASMRAYVRLPVQGPTLQTLQDALAEWEPVWRQIHKVSLTASPHSNQDTPAMARSQSEPVLPAVIPPPTAPLPPPPPRPPRSEQRQAVPGSPQWSRTSASVTSLSQTYDPARVVPAANGQPRMYRRPDSTRVMRLNRNCGKCGQAHFDFEHEHLLSSGQLHTLHASDYDEADESELDLASAATGASF
ncbi:hypothetical protein OC834_007284 [Tilletia horrida]|nr:hypothetical protein OC834_007284 [Tilletia horrida]KAK0546182.1 hypothetical protein OC844_007278 [Tilletia horrida]